MVNLNRILREKVFFNFVILKIWQNFQKNRNFNYEKKSQCFPFLGGEGVGGESHGWG